MEQTGKRGLSAAALKHLAIVLMVIDHACIILFRAAGYDGFWFRGHWYLTRASFVLFAFQIAEGMVKTHDRRRYLLRLGILAVLSEVPFDLFFSGTVFAPGRSNVFVTLFLGAASVALAEGLGEAFGIKQLLVILGGAVLADLLGADHGAAGCLVIPAFYFLRDRPGRCFLAVALILALNRVLLQLSAALDGAVRAGELFDGMAEKVALELHGALAFPLIARYNGEKGKMLPKPFYYLFYPAHLLLLFGLAWILF